MDSTDRRSPNTARRSRLGMREIARLVGVSPITVSRALNDPDKVSPETRDKVLRRELLARLPSVTESIT